MNWVQVVLAVTAPVAGVAGVLLGSWAVNRREDRRWRLETKLSLYIQIARAGEELRACVDESLLPDLLDDLRRKDKDLPVGHRYFRALDSFTLLLPQAAVVASEEVYNAMRSYVVLAETAGAEVRTEVDPGYWQESSDLNGRHWEVLDSMRVDLGFGPPQMHIGWPGQEALKKELDAAVQRAQGKAKANVEPNTT